MPVMTLAGAGACVMCRILLFVRPTRPTDEEMTFFCSLKHDKDIAVQRLTFQGESPDFFSDARPLPGAYFPTPPALRRGRAPAAGGRAPSVKNFLRSSLASPRVDFSFRSVSRIFGIFRILGRASKFICGAGVRFEAPDPRERFFFVGFFSSSRSKKLLDNHIASNGTETHYTNAIKIFVQGEISGAEVSYE